MSAPNGICHESVKFDGGEAETTPSGSVLSSAPANVWAVSSAGQSIGLLRQAESFSFSRERETPNKDAVPGVPADATCAPSDASSVTYLSRELASVGPWKCPRCGDLLETILEKLRDRWRHEVEAREREAKGREVAR